MTLETDRDQNSASDFTEELLSSQTINGQWARKCFALGAAALGLAVVGKAIAVHEQVDQRSDPPFISFSDLVSGWQRDGSAFTIEHYARQISPRFVSTECYATYEGTATHVKMWPNGRGFDSETIDHYRLSDGTGSSNAFNVWLEWNPEHHARIIDPPFLTGRKVDAITRQKVDRPLYLTSPSESALVTLTIGLQSSVPQIYSCKFSETGVVVRPLEARLSE